MLTRLLHYSNSELGQTIWKSSGLANIVGTMTDQNGNLELEKVVNSFENPSLRRRWVRSLTNFVAEWISHISDPATRQRYLATAQYVGNGFLKSQGYPKSVMFDSVKPAESLSRSVQNQIFLLLVSFWDTKANIKLLHPSGLPMRLRNDT